MCIPWCVYIYIYIHTITDQYICTVAGINCWIFKAPFSVLVRYSGFLVHIILVTSCLLATSNLSILAASAIQSRIP